jgi:hypothetical protein
VVEGENVFEASQSPNAGRTGKSHCRRSGKDHNKRLPDLVSALRLSGDTQLETAIGELFRSMFS